MYTSCLKTADIALLHLITAQVKKSLVLDMFSSDTIMFIGAGNTSQAVDKRAFCGGVLSYEGTK